MFRIDWRRDEGGVFRILDAAGIVIARCKTVEISTPSRLVNIDGHGWLETDGKLHVNNDAAVII